LDLDKKARPVKQRLHRFTQDPKEAIRVEVTQLLATNFIHEVAHPEWLANPVLVKKKNGEWRMCVYYTDLNKHSPKDPFPLPGIDRVVDSSPSSTAILSGIRSPSRNQIKGRLRSLPPSGHTATTP
jgi:hypothetical protein